MLDVNLIGTWMVSKRLRPADGRRRRGRTHLQIVSSQAGKKAFPMLGPYRVRRAA